MTDERRDPGHLGYVPSLDGLRAIAVLCVVALHLHSRKFRFGYMGVDVFFVLSGFLITTVLLERWRDTGRIDLPNFYRRRALRLLPAATCLFAVSLLPFNPGAFATRAWAALMASMYVANWAQIYGWAHMGVLTHTWSLAIEEQFYLIWAPLLMLLLRYRATRSRLMAVVVGGIGCAVLTRLFLLWAGSDPGRIYDGLDTRADSLLIGCLASVALMFHSNHRIVRNTRAHRIFAAFFAILVLRGAVFSNWWEPYNFIVGQPALELLTAIVIVELVTRRESILSRVLGTPSLVWIGRLSYSLYLWHFLLLEVLEPIPMHYYLHDLLGLGATFLAATISYYVVERPFLRMKGRARPSHALVAES